MIKIIWLIATVYFMSRLVRRVVSSMQEINTERNASCSVSAGCSVANEV